MRVSTVENGRRRKIPAQELIFRGLAHDAAVKRDPKAIRTLLALMERYEKAMRRRSQREISRPTINESSMILWPRWRRRPRRRRITGRSSTWRRSRKATKRSPLLGGKIHHRKIGDVLSPTREPRHILNDLKRQLGSDYFSAQYQQEPVPPGGALIKRHWVQRYSGAPPRGRCSFILQSWDTAAKGAPDSDYSVCTTWHQIDGTQ